MPLPDTPNFRDFGGHALADGRRVRRGHFFRSASLHAVSERDRAALRRLDPALILDLRGVGEREAAPARLGAALEGRIVSLPIEPGVGPLLRCAQAEGRLTAALAKEVMAAAYRGYAGAHFPQFCAALRHVCVPRDRPVVVHCSAGKDRTGFLVLLILAGLGVGEAAIRADYLETNARLRPGGDALSNVPQDVRDAVRGVRPGYLDAAIAALTARQAYPDTLAQALLPEEAHAFRAWAVQG